MHCQPLSTPLSEKMQDITPTVSHVALIVTGSIAAYKAAALASGLAKSGMNVHTILTDGGASFINDITFQAITGHRVRKEIFDVDAESAMSHIDLAREAQLVIVAPASASFLSELATGGARTLGSTVCLATEAPVWIFPAMNAVMWRHPLVQQNVQRLRGAGYRVFDVDAGRQACGEVGDGRMAEPEAIELAVRAFTGRASLSGRHVVVTAGPTHEPMDPVRYLGNRSSGKMGCAVAAAAVAAGAKVTLIHGPLSAEMPVGITPIPIETAQQMCDAVMAHQADVFVGVAAVADWSPGSHDAKLKKSDHQGPPAVTLNENPHVLKAAAASGHYRTVVGFCAETGGDLAKEAARKCAEYGCDAVCANDVSHGTGAFNAEENALIVVSRDGVVTQIEGHKLAVAAQLVEQISRWTEIS